MIIEIPDSIIPIKKDTIIIFDDSTKKFKTITKSDFLSEVNHELKSLKEEMKMIKSQFSFLQKADLINNFKLLKYDFENDEIKDSLVVKVAFSLLQTDIIIGDIVEPNNYEYIKSWVKKPTNEIPDVLKDYIDLVKGEK